MDWMDHWSLNHATWSWFLSSRFFFQLVKLLLSHSGDWEQQDNCTSDNTDSETSFFLQTFLGSQKSAKRVWLSRLENYFRQICWKTWDNFEKFCSEKSCWEMSSWLLFAPHSLSLHETWTNQLHCFHYPSEMELLDGTFSAMILPIHSWRFPVDVLTDSSFIHLWMAPHS